MILQYKYEAVLQSQQGFLERTDNSIPLRSSYNGPEVQNTTATHTMQRQITKQNSKLQNKTAKQRQKTQLKKGRQRVVMLHVDSPFLLFLAKVNVDVFYECFLSIVFCISALY